nr:YggT family protein [Pullulanibacillus pueri]
MKEWEGGYADVAGRKRFLVTKILNVVVSAVQILLGLYIVLKLFGAAEVPFVRWIYDLSKPFLAPFEGVFKPILFQEEYLLDLSALFALIIYSIVGYIIIRLVMAIESR